MIIGAAFTGSFRRFERIAVAFCVGSLLLIPLYFLAHPAAAQMAHDFVVPRLPGGAGQLSTVMLLVIGIVGTTVAPWQLFFQQSYVIDKRITPRFMKYEKADLWIGIVIVVIGGGGHHGRHRRRVRRRTRGFGHFTDAAGLASGLQAYAGRTAGVLFAIALLDASIIGAFAVSLSTAYAISDVFGLNHSLHRGVKGAKGFYAHLRGPHRSPPPRSCSSPARRSGCSPRASRSWPGVLLPSASVFLLLLCNDKDVLGPWVNGRKTNLFTAGGRRRPGHAVGHPDRVGAVPGHHRAARSSTSWSCCGAASLAGRRIRHGPAAAGGHPGRRGDRPHRPGELADAAADAAAAAAMSAGRKIGMSALRLYLAVAMILVIVKIVQLALGH